MAAGDLSFLYGQSVPRCDHDIDKRFEGYCTLQYIAGGEVDLSVGSRRWTLEGRWFFSCWPGPQIRFRSAVKGATWVHRYIAFRGPLVARWTSEKLFPVWPQRPPRLVDYGRRFDEMLEQALRPGRLARLKAAHLLEGMLIDLCEHRAPAATEDEPWVERAMAALEEASRGGEVDHVAVARSLGMAESTLRRKFRSAVGIAPHAYVLQCRVAEARRLLAGTDEPIKAIAARLGYRDVYFFNRQFAKLTGLPPGAWRRSQQG